MARNELGGLRRSQAIATYGPGAIVDFRAGRQGGSVSVVAAGLDAWDDRAGKPGLGNDQVISEPRLQAALGVDGFRLPPVTPEVGVGRPNPNADKLVGIRFPVWLQCPQCHRLQRAPRWDEEPGEAALFCSRCSDGHKVFVVPVRFVMACELGHLDEFPWDRWVEHKPECKKMKALMLEAGESAGLAGLTLSCLECKASKSMEGCFSAQTLRGIGIVRCQGRRPWLETDDAPHDDVPKVVQRGASNLYFAVIESALDIPPWSDPLQKRLQADQHWNKLLELEKDERPIYVKMFKLVEKLEVSKEQILERVQMFEDREQNPTTELLRWEEYNQLIKCDVPYGDAQAFEVRAENVPPDLEPWIAKISVATRLREVRAVKGFTRIIPPRGSNDERMAPIAVHPKNWLPAIEVHGEGIFIQLNEDALVPWEAHPTVARRAKRLHDALERRGRGLSRNVTARFVLIHSLAHALIRQLSLACGYASASLRERLYVGHDETNMAGLLIYTASADADGTLGGLARQGRASDFAHTLEAAIRGLAWCSSDPLCIEARQAASHQLNLSACHACLMASETSCEEFNYLLDRTMLVGLPEDPAVGFFRHFVVGDDDA